MGIGAEQCAHFPCFLPSYLSENDIARFGRFPGRERKRSRPCTFTDAMRSPLAGSVCTRGLGCLLRQDSNLLPLPCLLVPVVLALVILTTYLPIYLQDCPVYNTWSKIGWRWRLRFGWERAPALSGDTKSKARRPACALSASRVLPRLYRVLRMDIQYSRHDSAPADSRHLRRPTVGR